MGANLSKYFSRIIWVIFSNDINIIVRIYLLFDYFRNNVIIFLFFSYLSNCYKFWHYCINNISYLFFFQYSSDEIGLSRPILEVIEFLIFAFWIFFDSHYLLYLYSLDRTNNRSHNVRKNWWIIKKHVSFYGSKTV